MSASWEANGPVKRHRVSPLFSGDEGGIFFFLFSVVESPQKTVAWRHYPTLSDIFAYWPSFSSPFSRPKRSSFASQVRAFWRKNGWNLRRFPSLFIWSVHNFRNFNDKERARTGNVANTLQQFTNGNEFVRNRFNNMRLLWPPTPKKKKNPKFHCKLILNLFKNCNLFKLISDWFKIYFYLLKM